jgi:hypothetical protein
VNYLIGCGGGGSHLLPDLVRLVPSDEIVVIDGDTLEEKNLDRQLFDSKDVGRNKAEALADRYGLVSGWSRMPEYFHSNLLRLKPRDWLFGCADNHACRKEILISCDRYRCRAVIAANETVDFEAYAYLPEWKDTPNDPRVFYPEILTVQTGNPLGPPGCVEAARTNPQLVVANATAAQFALWLFWFYTKEVQKLPKDCQQYWPVMHRGCPTGIRTTKFGDRLREVQAA